MRHNFNITFSIEKGDVTSTIPIRDFVSISLILIQKNSLKNNFINFIVFTGTWRNKKKIFFFLEIFSAPCAQSNTLN